MAKFEDYSLRDVTSIDHTGFDQRVLGSIRVKDGFHVESGEGDQSPEAIHVVVY
jgi:hypothetical protein